MGKKTVEIIARGVCVQEGQLLLCHSKGAANTYLPGGHVEFDERAQVALERDLDEEMGRAARAGRFMGAVEHTFVQKGKPHCEINLVFELSVTGLVAGQTPPSAEDHIEFLWCALDELADSGLEPAPLRAQLPDWIAGKVGWASTYA